MLKVAELFSGVGAQAKALERLQRDYGLEFEVVATSDIEKDAILSYAAIHCGLTSELVNCYPDYPSREEMATYLSSLNIGYDFKENKPYDWAKLARRKNNSINKYYLAAVLSKQVGDISKVEKLPKSDMWIYSFPCTDISSAGLQKGFSKDSGTRSSLVWQVLRLLKISAEKNELPKYLLMENVKNLVGTKFIKDFSLWVNTLDELGYKTVWEVQNAKDFGVPQNRERVFAISILKSENQSYEFPKGFPLEIRLKDILEHNVDEKYYLKDEYTEKLLEQINGKDVSNAVRGGWQRLDRQAQLGRSSGETDLFSVLRTERELHTPADERTSAELESKQGRCMRDRAEYPSPTKSFGVILEHNGTDFQKFADVSTCLQARGYKGFNNYGQTGVIEIE